MNEIGHNPEVKTNTSTNARSNPATGLSCKWFIACAVLLSAIFLALHLLRFRKYTSILSGTGSFSTWYQCCGVIYIFFYICFVVIVPILLIASTVIKAVGFLKHLYTDKNSAKLPNCGMNRTRSKVLQLTWTLCVATGWILVRICGAYT